MIVHPGYWVYRHIGPSNFILYVGRTESLLARTATHLKTSPWRDEIMSVEAVSFETYEEMCSAEAYYINRWRPERNKGIPNRPLVAPVPTTAWHTLWSRDPARVDELDRNDYSDEIQALKKELTEARQQTADYAVAAHRVQSAYQQLSVRNERSENKLAKVRRIVEYG